ncbi:RNA-directed DNA polymerase from mobile element jockey [Trichonephila clavipes]|nr:RNA-directed DNA polymerase from mobile element jockey [Trichonephila clavipes]
MYADDTAISACFRNSKTVTLALNKHLALLEKFFDKWKIKINVEKSAAVAFTYKRTLPPPPIMYNQIIPWSQETKYLGLIFDNKLTWKKHITYARDKFRKEDSLFHSDSSLKTFRDVKIHASKLRLLACRHSSNSNDLLPNMKTQRSAMSLKRLLPDTGLRVLRTQVPE